MRRFVPLMLCLSACTPVSPEGRMEVEIAGSVPVQRGVAAAGTQDGYAVSFTHFHVVVTDISVSPEVSTQVTLRQGLPQLVDLVPARAVRVLESPAAPGNYPMVSLSLAPAASVQSSAAEADVARRMETEKWSILVEGTITGPSGVKNFSWGFGSEHSYGSCNVGARVTEGQSSLVRMVGHGERLFRQSLVAGEDVLLRAAAFYNADADGDANITVNELRQVSGNDLRNGTWPSVPSDVADLSQWAERAMAGLVTTGADVGCRSSTVVVEDRTDAGM